MLILRLAGISQPWLPAVIERIPMETNLRRCLSCRQVAPKTSFWRVVRTYPDKTIVIDQGMGRSAYLCPSSDCLRLAQKKQRLGRALKVSAVPDSVYEQLWLRLENSE